MNDTCACPGRWTLTGRLSLLADGLKDKSEAVRIESLIAAGDLGGSAAALKSAIALLAQDDPSSTVRDIASSLIQDEASEQ